MLGRLARLGLENDTLREENQKLRTRKQAADELNKLIGPYANKAFWFMCAYCLFVGGTLVASGSNAGFLSAFKLETSVLEFLVGSTAVTVIGLVGMVLTGVFVGARK